MFVLVGSRDNVVKKIGVGHYFQLDLDQDPNRAPSLNSCKM